MQNSDKISVLKTIMRENDVPFFTNEELDFYLTQNKGDVYATAYQCLLIKAEDTTLQVSGLTTGDSSTYFRRLANMYRPTNSRILASAT